MPEYPVFIGAQRVVSIPSRCRSIFVVSNDSFSIFVFFAVVTFSSHFLKLHFVTMHRHMSNVFFYPNVFRIYFKTSFKATIITYPKVQFNDRRNRFVLICFSLHALKYKRTKTNSVQKLFSC